MFVLFALLSLAHAACPIVGGLCSSISGNTCQIEGGDTQKIVCDLDRMGAGDGAYYVWLTVYYSGATFDRIQGQDANGSAFCCDASRMGSTSPLESLKIYSVDNEVPATGYAWSNVIDASQEQAALADEIELVRRMRPDGDSEVQHPGGRKGIATGDVPERQPGSDERPARQILVGLDVHENLVLAHFALVVDQTDAYTGGAGDFPVVLKPLRDTDFHAEHR